MGVDVAPHGGDGRRLGDDGVEDVHGRELRVFEPASLARGAAAGMRAIRDNRAMAAASPTLSPRALELAQTLVRMNTVSANSNLELIHFIRDELAQLGVQPG